MTKDSVDGDYLYVSLIRLAGAMQNTAAQHQCADNEYTRNNLALTD